MCIPTHNYIPTKEGGGTHTSSAPKGAHGDTHIRCTRRWRWYTHPVHQKVEVHTYSYILIYYIIILHTVYYFTREMCKETCSLRGNSIRSRDLGELLAGMVSEIIESIYRSTSAQSQHLVCSYIQIVTPIYSIECATI